MRPAEGVFGQFGTPVATCPPPAANQRAGGYPSVDAAGSLMDATIGADAPGPRVNRRRGRAWR